MSANDQTMELERKAGERTTLIERLAERLGGSAGARAVYGDAVIRNGVTVIPVAKVAYGFGGGGGRSPQGDGEGGGGGVSATPVGYIEMREDGASFHRIIDPLTLVPLIAAAGVACAVILRGIRKLDRSNDCVS